MCMLKLRDIRTSRYRPHTHISDWLKKYVLQSMKKKSHNAFLLHHLRNTWIRSGNRNNPNPVTWPWCWCCQKEPNQFMEEGHGIAPLGATMTLMSWATLAQSLHWSCLHAGALCAIGMQDQNEAPAAGPDLLMKAFFSVLVYLHRLDPAFLGVPKQLTKKKNASPLQIKKRSI